MSDSPILTPLPQRVRNELAFRRITVKDKVQLASSFYRLTFSGDALAGFSSRGFDDHIKLFFPDAQSGVLLMPTVSDGGVVWPEGPRPAMRDYTPLTFDAQNNLLTLDFYIHAHGVASDWAAAAQPGDTLVIGGPRGSLVVPTGYSKQIYVCDETGLPAMQRRLHDLAASPASRQLSLYAFTDAAVGEAYLETELPLARHWLGSGAMHGAALEKLLTVLQAQAPGEDYFIWMTGEGAAVKMLADALLATTPIEKDRLRAVAYWHAKTAAAS
ncbi:NADPH-dependent ferric siderophore reductase [Izhakiella australiensis]|uniref:NADPH-dependent ferric siderophore reductase n=1 Tax=Izhakiella australiensis TaxID=1926881 RepID=A0A1S8YSD5_9GAMM|nr:siderophore-interacting protein [Izhakiella australiensis]OON41994.1 NADPH-dependent ferric siderophore reductase [Izhakiella australiensis]